MARVQLIYLDEYADEGGNFPVTVTFKDRDGLSNGVTAVNFRLTDKDGNVQNGRDNVSVSVADPTEIVLEGDDLKCSTGFSGLAEERRLGVKVTYNSSLGDGKIQTAEAVFFVKNSAALPIS